MLTFEHLLEEVVHVCCAETTVVHGQESMLDLNGVHESIRERDQWPHVVISIECLESDLLPVNFEPLHLVLPQSLTKDEEQVLRKGGAAIQLLAGSGVLTRFLMSGPVLRLTVSAAVMSWRGLSSRIIRASAARLRCGRTTDEAFSCRRHCRGLKEMWLKEEMWWGSTNHCAM
jgi:hypothetical protein